MKRRMVMTAAMMAAAMGMAALTPLSFAKDKPDTSEPQAWGMQSGNTGCVIFRESQETETENLGGSYKTHTVKQLEVVDAMQAKLPHKKYSETKEDLDALQQLSMADSLKYVKIPKKYTPEQMEKAKEMCGVKGQ